MQQLYEIRVVRQIPNEKRRRWFTCVDLDLIVWYDTDDSLVAFQFCYDKSRREHALTWRADGPCTHLAVDDGESAGFGVKMSPILIANGKFDVQYMLDCFANASAGLPPEIIEFVKPRLGHATLRKR